MRVLVSGASGFIGGALAVALGREGHTVRGLGRTAAPGMEWRQADLADPQSLQGCCAGIDAVCHLAGSAHVNAPRAVHEAITVEGTRALLAEAKSAGVQSFLFVSSIKAVCSRDDYARSRLAAEALVLAANGMASHVVRPALVYGPGMKGNLAHLLAWAGRPAPLPIPKGLAVRSMVHRDDLVAVIVALLAKVATTGPWVVSDGLPYTLWDIYAAMRHACHRRVLPLHVPAVWVRGAAAAGDVLGRLSGRALPFDSGALRPLLESCYVEDRQVWRALGMNPRWTLATALAGMMDGENG